MFYVSGGSERLNCTYFTCLGGSWGGPDSANLRGRVGPLKKDLTRAGGGEGGGVGWGELGAPGCGIMWELS